MYRAARLRGRESARQDIRNRHATDATDTPQTRHRPATDTQPPPVLSQYVHAADTIDVCVDTHACMGSEQVCIQHGFIYRSCSTTSHAHTDARTHARTHARTQSRSTDAQRKNSHAVACEAPYLSIVFVAYVCRDGEPWRHVDSNVAHFCKVGTLVSEQLCLLPGQPQWI